MGSVTALPGAALPPIERDTVTLSPDELRGITGYARPAEQLRVLHDRGFARAWRLPSGGRVILERAHYDAVSRGQFAQPVEIRGERAPVAANSSALRQFLTKKRGA